VRKSYAALAELQPGRFARVERDGGAVAPALEVAAVEAERAVQATATIREAIATTPTAALDSGQKKSLRSAAAIAAESGSGVAADLVTAAAAAAAVDPAASTHYNRLGIALRQAGRFAESRAAYGQAIAADPGNAEVECNLAILLDLYLGQSAEALPHYERGQSLAGEGDGEIDKWVVEVRARLGREQRTAEARE
jgi:Flp pilus assembly protein TadD